MWIGRLSEIALASAIGLLAWDASAQPTPPTSDDGLAESRERFKQGMQLYEQGAPGEAIAVWEPIYRELGEHRAYRLAYDLGLAYAALDDDLHSADRLQAFLNEVDSRRSRGEAIGAAVTKEESDARTRLARLASILGRVQGASSRPGVLLRVDAGDPHPAGAIVWVTPGPHTVTFDPETRDAQTVPIDVAVGALVELVPPSPPTKAEASPPPTQPAPGPAAESAPLPEAATPPGGEAPAPVPPVLIAITGGVTVAAGVAAVALEIHANALRNHDIAEQARSPDGTISAADRASFATARDWAYVAVGSAVGFGVLTGGLAVWYFVGRANGGSRHSAPAVGLGLQGPRLVLDGSF
jgi:hypothetical protein